MTYLKKWWAGSTTPAHCIQCDGLSYVPETISNGTFSIGALLLVFTAIISVHMSSWLAASVGLALSIICYGLLWHLAQLRATTLEQVATAKKLSWGMFIIAAIMALLT